MACGADGVHVGQDARASDVRGRSGAGRVLGVSVAGRGPRRGPRRRPAPTTWASPCGPRPTKPDATARGLDGPARGRRRGRRCRWSGIGGIDPRNAAEVLAAGAAGVAVISAVAAAPEPAAVVRALCAGPSTRSARSRRPAVGEQRTGKATAELFEQVILRRLGARRPRRPRGSAARRRRRRRPGRRRPGDGAHGRSGLRGAGLRVGARGLVRGAHPRLRRGDERPAAAVDGRGPEPAARALRRGPRRAVDARSARPATTSGSRS